MDELETWEKVTFSCRPASKKFSFIKSLLKNPPPTKIFSMYQTLWTIHISLTIRRKPIEKIGLRFGDKKTHLGAEIRCNWTPLSLQGEHFITTIFWITDGNPLQTIWRVVENLLAIILIPVTVRREEFANLFVTLKRFSTLDKKENQTIDDVLNSMNKNLRRLNKVSHVNILHALVDLYDIWTWYQLPLAAPCYE